MEYETLSNITGCVGGVCALANVLGAHLLELHTKYHNNVFDSELQRRLIDPNTMVNYSYLIGFIKMI